MLEVSVDGQRAGRLVVELLDELLPETSENFRLLCSGDAPSGASDVESTLAAAAGRGRATGLAGGAPRVAACCSRHAFADRPLRGRGLLRAARGARAVDDGERGRRRPPVAALMLPSNRRRTRRAMRHTGSVSARPLRSDTRYRRDTRTLACRWSGSSSSVRRRRWARIFC